jgi:heptosyltransferase-2
MAGGAALICPAVPETPISLTGPVVVRSPNWLGDAVMALPAVRNLKALLGTEPLTVAAPDKLAAWWEACPCVDRVIALREPRRLVACAGQLREGKFGAAVLLPNSLRAALEARLAGIGQRVGYARGGRGWLLTQAIPVPEQNPARMHQRFYYLDLVAALGGSPDDSMPALRDAGSPAPNEFQVAICPGAEYGPAKRWPAERFLEVARHFAAQKAKIVLLGAAGDAEVCAELAAQLPGAENRAGRTTLAEFMAALAASRLAVCNDSGAMHVAAALGVPTVAIFGSTEPALTGPLGPSARVIRHHVPCSPCFLRVCPIDFACMTSISPARVIAAAEALLAARTERA